MTFKVGDEVKLKESTRGTYSGWRGQRLYITSERKMSGSEYYYDTRRADGNTGGAYESDLELITNTMTNIKESFALAFKAEPEKSFRKAGITNGDDFLTTDGQHIFLSWLLKKHGEEFKKDVVDGLLEDMQKKSE